MHVLGESVSNICNSHVFQGLGHGHEGRIGGDLNFVPEIGHQKYTLTKIAQGPYKHSPSAHNRALLHMKYSLNPK